WHSPPLSHARRRYRFSGSDFLPHGPDRPVRGSFLAVHFRAVDFLRAHRGFGVRLAPQGTRPGSAVSGLGIPGRAGDFRGGWGGAYSGFVGAEGGAGVRLLAADFPETSLPSPLEAVVFR